MHQNYLCFSAEYFDFCYQNLKNLIPINFIYLLPVLVYFVLQKTPDFEMNSNYFEVYY
jgi:hypothetical protein